MGRIVIVAMRPKPGHEEALRSLVDRHHSDLDAEGLVTDRAPTVMHAADGTVIEVFEWKSAEAIEAAHSNPAVQSLWEQYAQVCDFIAPTDVDEFSQLFSEFSPGSGGS